MSEQYPIFFDLQKKLTTDPSFCDEVQEILSGIATAYATGDTEKLKRQNTALLRKCDFNPSLLLPYMYPDFLDGEPMTLWSRPHAFAMMAMIPNGSLTIAASRQIGKCVTGDTTVRVRDESQKEGYRPMSMRDLFNQCKARKKATLTIHPKAVRYSHGNEDKKYE